MAIQDSANAFDHRMKRRVAENAISSTMDLRTWRSGCRKVFADEEAIETRRWRVNTVTIKHGRKVFADEEAIETSASARR